MSDNPHPEIAVAGSGAIATGLAALASATSDKVWILARSKSSAESAIETVTRACERIDGADAARVHPTTDAENLRDSTLVVEAIIEDFEAKSELLGRVGSIAARADLATTTSSLPVAGIAEASGHTGRLFALHVFNPVPVMKLIEICLPDGCDPAVGERARSWCEANGKTAVEVPDTPGFVVNRLLFPYLFDAVRLLDRTGMTPADVDSCMTLGVNHPMGPLGLLDLIGLDIAGAIGDALYAESGNDDHRPPAGITDRIAAGDLGRKTGRGFYEY